MKALFIGDDRHAEFQDAIRWLERRAELVRCRVPEAVLRGRFTWEPDLVILAQTRPGIFAQAAVELVHAKFPLARLVALLGSWCEGEMRSGRPWSGVKRVYWHSWESTVSCWRSSGLPAIEWDLPRTATASEQLAPRQTPAGEEDAGLLAIAADQYYTFDMLAGLCSRGGFSTVWLPPRGHFRIRSAKAVLFDGTSCDAAVEEYVRTLAVRLSPAPLVALFDFPREADVRGALAAGASAVIAKPFANEHLLKQLQVAVSKSEAARRSSSAA